MIAVVCVHRPPPNGHTTIAAMLLADARAALHRFVICLDADDIGAFSAYRHLAEVRLVPSAESDRALRAARTFAACLRVPPTGEEPGIIIAEDDITLSRKWLGFVGDGNHMVLGYSRFAEPYEVHPAEQPLWGSLLLYVPNRYREPLANALDITEKPADDTIGEWCRDHEVTILLKPVAQHLGTKSVIEPASILRESPVWRPEIP